MIFLKAFLLAGLWCALLQAVFLATKWHPGYILAGGFTVGGFLAAIGWMEPLVIWGQAGMMALVIDGGEAVVQGVIAMFHGEFMPILTFLIIMASVIILGLIVSVINVAVRSKKVEPSIVTPEAEAE